MRGEVKGGHAWAGNLGYRVTRDWRNMGCGQRRGHMTMRMGWETGSPGGLRECRPMCTRGPCKRPEPPHGVWPTSGVQSTTSHP